LPLTPTHRDHCRFPAQPQTKERQPSTEQYTQSDYAYLKILTTYSKLSGSNLLSLLYSPYRLLRIMEAVQDTHALEKDSDRLSWLCTILQPIKSLLLINIHGRGLNTRIIPTNVLDDTTIARGARIGDYHAIARGFLHPRTF